MRKRLIVIVSILSLLLGVSCNRRRVVERQTDCHERISDYEEYILTDFGECLRFENPVIDDDTKSLSMDVFFLSSFIDNVAKETEILKLMEEVRLSTNEYLSDNPNSFMNDGYNITLAFYEASDDYISSTPDTEWGLISNHLSGNYSVENSMCNVRYTGIINAYEKVDVSFDGVREINLESVNDVDLILGLLERMPDIEIVLVRNDVIDLLSEARPDVVFT